EAGSGSPGASARHKKNLTEQNRNSILAYFELLKYFQWPEPSSGGATITELDTHEVSTMEGNMHDRMLKGSGRAPQITKIERSIATTFTKTVRVNITSCNKPFESSPKKRKEEHERGSDEPKGGNHQPTIVSSEHRLSLVNNRQFVDLDGEKEVPTRKRTGVKNYRHW
ncbi:unnamed protein product, partial [Porites lobata]